MRILMLNNEFPPLGGGTATVNLMLFREFRKQPDLEIDLITSSRGKSTEEESYAPLIHIYKVPVDNRNIHHARNRELASYAMRALNLARKLCRENSYCLSMAWHTVPAGAVSLALKKRFKLPFIVRIGGSDIPGFERRYKILATLLTPLIRKTWREAAGVIVKCREETEMLRRIDSGIDPLIIPNGVDTGMFVPGPPPHLKGPLRLICVARLIERKGYGHVFEALKKLHREGYKIRLIVVGTGDSENVYRDTVARSGLNETVTFLGYVPHDQVPQLYQTADAFVLGSEAEGMSLSTLEAMASGLPLLITRTGGSRELLEEGVNGFSFEYGDVNALCRGLRTLADDRSLARRMGETSRRKAESLPWSAAAGQYHRLFKEIGQKVELDPEQS